MGNSNSSGKKGYDTDSGRSSFEGTPDSDKSSHPLYISTFTNAILG